MPSLPLLFLLFSRLQKKPCVEGVGGGEKIVVGKLKGKLVLKFISISEINPVPFVVSKFQYNILALAYFLTKANRFCDKFNLDGA